MVAWPAGDAALAKAMHGAQGDFHAALIKPIGNLPVRPMFAPQFKDRLAMRFQFAARPPRNFVFRLGLKIHFAVLWFALFSRKIRAKALSSPFPVSSAKGRCLTKIID